MMPTLLDVCDHETDRCTGPVEPREGACRYGHEVTATMCTGHSGDEVVCWPCWRDDGDVVLIRLGGDPC